MFYLFLFCIPLQTRVLWQQWSLPFNEWVATFIFFSDILLLLLLILWAVREFGDKLRPRNQIEKPHLKKTQWLLLIFFIAAALSTVNAKLIALAFFRLIKLAEFIGLFFYIRSAYPKIFIFSNVAEVIVVSGIFKSIIAILQYWKQASLGLKLLGESVVSVNTYNVAVIIAAGEKYLRVYGTFPHPNVLAAWLLVAIAAFYYFYLNGSRYKKYFLTGYVLMLCALFFTYSRVIIGLWGLLFLIVSGQNFRNKKIQPVVIATIMTSLAFVVLFWPQVNSRIHISADEEAVTQRIYYNKIAGKIAEHNSVLGIGIGQFVLNLMKQYPSYPGIFYQPAHNIYLLMAAETGIISLLVFLIFLGLVLFQARQKNIILLTTVCLLLVAGLFDHFLWDLQSGSLLFWLSLGWLTVDI